MSLRFIGKNILTLTLLATATIGYAKTHVGKILCPPINAIQQASQKLDNVMPLAGKYIISASIPINAVDRLWYISIGDVNATSCNEALIMAKETLQKASIQQVYATSIDDGDFFSCSYGPGNIQAATLGKITD